MRPLEPIPSPSPSSSARSGPVRERSGARPASTPAEGTAPAPALGLPQALRLASSVARVVVERPREALASHAADTDRSAAVALLG
jgi:hypothetical protein